MKRVFILNLILFSFLFLNSCVNYSDRNSENNSMRSMTKSLQDIDKNTLSAEDFDWYYGYGVKVYHLYYESKGRDWCYGNASTNSLDPHKANQRNNKDEYLPTTCAYLSSKGYIKVYSKTGPESFGGSWHIKDINGTVYTGWVICEPAYNYPE